MFADPQPAVVVGERLIADALAAVEVDVIDAPVVGGERCDHAVCLYLEAPDVLAQLLLDRVDVLAQRLHALRRLNVRLRMVASDLPRQVGHIPRKLAEVSNCALQLPPQPSGHHHHEGDSEQHRQEAVEGDGARLPADLLVVPLGAEIDGDDCGDAAVGVKNRTVGAVKASPCVGVRLLVHRRRTEARRVQRVGVKDRFSELAGVLKRRIDHKGELPVSHVADGVDVFQIDIFLKYREGVVNRLIGRGALVRRAQVLQHVAVQHIRRRVGDVQHPALDQILHGGLGMADESCTQRQIDRQQDGGHNDDDLRGQVFPQLFHLNEPPLMMGYGNVGRLSDSYFIE